MSEIWRPSPARVADANLTRFIASVSARTGLKSAITTTSMRGRSHTLPTSGKSSHVSRTCEPTGVRAQSSTSLTGCRERGSSQRSSELRREPAAIPR